MKILLVNDFGYYLGGAETYFFNFKKWLEQKGHKVFTLSSNCSRDNDKFLTDFQVSESGNFFNLDRYFNVVNYFQFKKILKKINPDIIHLNNIFYTLSPSILFAVQNYKTVMTLHDFYIICPTYKTLPDHSVCNANFGPVCLESGCISKNRLIKEKVKRYIIKVGLKNICLFIAPSAYLKSEFEKSGVKNIVVLHNTCEFATKGLIYKPSDSNNILFIGRLAKQKGVEILVRAIAVVAKKHQEVILQIAGGGEQEEYIKSLVHRLGVDKNVAFLGVVGGDRKIAIIKDSLFVVAPNIWPDIGTLVVPESACFGKTVIASNIGSINEYIKDGETGFLVPPGDPVALAEKILYLLENRSVLNRAGEALFKKYAESGIDQCINNLENIYKTL